MPAFERKGRSVSLLTTAACGAVAWAACAWVSGAAGRAFSLRAASASHSLPVPGRSIDSSRVTMRNFKEDFEAWRNSLSPAERELLQEQSFGEYNKAFRKSETFKQDISEEKIKAFGQILQKFFENESEDYKKQQKAKVPDYDGLLKKSGDKYTIDFSLKPRITVIDRDADRRYDYASERISEAEQKGEKFPQSSPLLERWAVQNNDTESHESAQKMLEVLKLAGEAEGCPSDCKPLIEEFVQAGVPPVGEDYELVVPETMVQQVMTLRVWILGALDELVKAGNHSAADIQAFASEDLPRVYAEVAKFMQENYVQARDEVQDGADALKSFFRSQAEREEELKGMSKADIMKEIWAEMPKFSDKPVPPLDEEMLAELADIPAIEEGEFMHSWGTADKLYKSEAIDSFGEEYLLGIYESVEAANEAFEEWNKAYEEARSVRSGEMEQWAKQEQARIDRDKGPGTDLIKEMLEEARR
eukprot:TRINITY_DN6394_c0_g2_i1.p1 TRINITY_DN6394_c0_g2~~TRINITY_DN6394_c0_g2_i1.p1  ORF type:complete len:474 (+),score=175.52 TRINITY_DN6394_c0_g2_i1:88-1509(+)